MGQINPFMKLKFQFKFIQKSINTNSFLLNNSKQPTRNFTVKQPDILK